MYINNFVNSRNRLLFRFPIYRKFGCGERNINLVKNYSSGIGCSQTVSILNENLNDFCYLFSVTRQPLVLNHINCRQKSSATDGNIQSLKLRHATREKIRKLRMLKTSVTQGMN